MSLWFFNQVYSRKKNIKKNYTLVTVQSNYDCATKQLSHVKHWSNLIMTKGCAPTRTKLSFNDVSDIKQTKLWFQAMNALLE